MKLAIFQPRISYFTGGSEKAALRHIEYLNRNYGLHIDVYTIRPPHESFHPEYLACKSRIGQQVRFYEIEIPAAYRYFYDESPSSDHLRWDSESLLFSALVSPLLQGKKYDCLLSYYIVDALYKPVGIPNAVYLGGYPRDEVPIYRSFVRQCHAVLANSNDVLTNWEPVLAHNKNLKKFVLKKGVDAPNAKEKESPFVPGGFHIVYVGRLIERKGVRVLIEAFERFVQEVGDVHLWIIGDGPERTHLESIVTSSNVHFLGTRMDAYDFYENADICVFPSIMGEGMLTTACEAMMCGACVVATTGNGNESFIHSGENGMLVPPGDANALLSALKYLYKDGVVRSKFGREARRYAQEHFSWEHATKDLYQKLLEIAAIRKS